MSKRGRALTALAVFALAGVTSVLARGPRAPMSSGDDSETYLPLVMTRCGIEGRVRYFKNVDKYFFDSYLVDASADEQAWMREYYWRMYAFPPYFDQFLGWYPDAWAYKGLYAAYRCRGDWDKHPHPDAWFLYDENHDRLFNKYDCPGGCPDGSCAMWAANICDQGFRSHWIGEAAQVLAQGYRGLWLDYVNMTLEEISDASGIVTTPHDYSGEKVTLPRWRDCMAAFMEQIEVTFPATEIIHNPLWWHEYPPDESALREIETADFVCIERGVNDAGLGAGDNFENLLAFIDAVHQHGTSIVFRVDSGVTGPEEREYGLAGWLLISRGNDGFASDPWGTPDDWWQGYQLDMGHALGARYAWEGVIRRDFSCGIVLLNKPNMPTVTIQLPET